MKKSFIFYLLLAVSLSFQSAAAQSLEKAQKLLVGKWSLDMEGTMAVEFCAEEDKARMLAESKDFVPLVCHFKRNGKYLITSKEKGSKKKIKGTWKLHEETVPADAKTSPEELKIPIIKAAVERGSRIILSISHEASSFVDKMWLAQIDADSHVVLDVGCPTVYQRE